MLYVFAEIRKILICVRYGCYDSVKDHCGEYGIVVTKDP